MSDLAHPDPAPRNASFMIALHLADADLASAEEQLMDMIAWLLFDKPRQAESRVKPVRVLVIDDAQDDAYTECALFSHLGHAAVPALNDREAVALAAMFSPDIVLLDIDRMGPSNGELVRRLRSCRKRSCIVGVSKGAQGEHEARSAGCDLFLPKPMDLAKLRHVLMMLSPLPSYTT